MNENVFKSINIVGFGNENETYRNLIKTILTAVIDIMNKSNITYDYQCLGAMISSLKVIQRDYEAHEYIEGENTLYVSKCNQTGEKYIDEDLIIFITHELMHFVTMPENGFYTEYKGFDEFFTEYLTSVIISKIGGIKFESYYRNNIKGYFGDGADNSIIKLLINKIGFEQLLNVYLNRNIERLAILTGKETLTTINRYYTYYDELTDLIGKPLREFQKIIQNPTMKTQKEILDHYVSTINGKIASYEIQNGAGKLI